LTLLEKNGGAHNHHCATLHSSRHHDGRLKPLGKFQRASLGTFKRAPTLSRHNCLVLRQNDEAYGIWRFSLGRKIDVVKVHGGLSSNDGEVALNWALDGHGILMRSEWDITKYLRSGRLELLLEDYALPPADIFAIYPERHNLLAKMRVFLDFLVAYFGEEASSNVGRKTPW
jgi:DNA-binding transcriptional LysR family regulator